MPERIREKAQTVVKEIPIDKIEFSLFQTREIVSEDELKNLAASILAQGIIQPVLVRIVTKSGDLSEQYELVAGERRLRAARLAGLETIPAIIKDLDERSAAEVSVIENAQRENLDPIEEAKAFKQLIESFKLTQAEVAEVAGKDRSTVANSLRLLQLEDRVQIYIRQGQLSAGHGRALLQVEPTKQYRLAIRTIEEQLSVHALERIIAKSKQQAKKSNPAVRPDAKAIAALRRQEERIGSYLKIDEVNITMADEGQRKLRLTFDNEAAWRRFLRKIKN
jgi:ParB family chromosome partitioning protein